MAAMLPLASRMPAQTLDVLHAFTVPNPTNSDGVYPLTVLVLSGGTLYGAASGGGTNNLGTVFSVGTDGSAFTVLHTFNGTNFANAEGARPQGSLILSGNTLYGTASDGGTNNAGTIFSLNTNGSAFTVLHTFATNGFTGDLLETNADGAGPNSLVLSDDGVLFGTAKGGGTNGYGTIFSLSTNGGGFSLLHTFKNKNPDSGTREGEEPESVLVLASGVLYGATPMGGTNTTGTLFSMTTNGATFKVLCSFPNTGINGVGTFLNGLVLSSNLLFGADALGGANGTGAIFSINTNGGGFTVIYPFTYTGGALTNQDGMHPEGALVLAGGTLYGTAKNGGTNSWGTIFSVNTDGSNFNTLYTFSSLHLATNADGAEPQTGLVLSGGTFYGTAYAGDNAYGNVFSLTLAPVISSLNLAGPNLTLNVANGVAGENCFVLTSTDLTQPLSQWTSIATNALSAGGNFSITATNAVNPAAPSEFYLLKVQ